MLFHDKIRHHKAHERGFTLIEIAMVLTIAAVMLLGALKFVIPLYQQAKRLETGEKLRIINEALETYAIKNFRIPCPADPRRAPSGGEPFGTERLSGATGDAIPANCGAVGTPANWSGIIPFRTLGLPENVIRDSWGRYITYAISPAFALDVSDVNLRVHPVCRTTEWFYPKDDNTTFMHRNPRKARFCCIAQNQGGTNNIYPFNTDLIVQSRIEGALVNGLAAPSPRQATGNGFPNNCTDCEAYATTSVVFSTTPNMSVPPADTSTGIAYILVSHGPNGFGSFDPAGNQLLPGNGGPDELENSDNDRTFIERVTVSDNGADYYDDVVLWRTQDLIFAEQGESCVKP